LVCVRHSLIPVLGVARPMIRVNCAAIPETLIESEFIRPARRRLPQARCRGRSADLKWHHGSTLCSSTKWASCRTPVQVKLLRVLQEKQIERLGSSKPISVDVRIIAATNRDLEAAVRENKFAGRSLLASAERFSDYKDIPPLRERTEDIRPLIESFVHEFAQSLWKDHRVPYDQTAGIVVAANLRMAWNSPGTPLIRVERAGDPLLTGPDYISARPKPPTNGTNHQPP